jgi:hypothetical protein
MIVTPARSSQFWELRLVPSGWQSGITSPVGRDTQDTHLDFDVAEPAEGVKRSQCEQSIRMGVHSAR